MAFFFEVVLPSQAGDNANGSFRAILRNQFIRGTWRWKTRQTAFEKIIGNSVMDFQGRFFVATFWQQKIKSKVVFADFMISLFKNGQ